MNSNKLIEALNENGGVVAVVLFLLSILGWLLVRAKRHFLPRKEEKWEKSTVESKHASDLYKEISDKTEWNHFKTDMGEFLIYDVCSGLPTPQELSDTESTKKVKHYVIGALTLIDLNFLEFDISYGLTTYIKKIGDTWCKSEMKEEGSHTVSLIGRLPYESIARIAWETNCFWEWPRIGCRYQKKRKTPFLKIFFAEEKKNNHGESFYIEMCERDDLTRKPDCIA